MAKFFTLHNADKAFPYTDALKNAGHVEVTEIEEADFLLIDYEQPVWVERINAFRGPVFVYPHCAVSDLLWDGLYTPSKKVKWNFVIGEGQRDVMLAYGYPRPICATGWPWSMVRKTTPRPIQTIVFAAIHPNKTGRRITKEDIKTNINTIDLLSTIPDVTVIVRYGGEVPEISGFRTIPTNFRLEQADGSIKSAMQSIAKSDLVVSRHTFAYLAVAMGAQTIFFDQNTVPHTTKIECKSFPKYKHIRKYPLELSEMGDLLQKGISAELFQAENVQNWKDRFIGKDFDHVRFVNCIERFL